jgi:hypothetical protein
MCISAAVASWLVPSLVAAAGSGVAAYQGHQQSQLNKDQANEAKRTALAQSQANAEKAPELLAQAGTSDAIKRRKASYGIEESIISNNMTNQTSGNQYWG